MNSAKVLLIAAGTSLVTSFAALAAAAPEPQATAPAAGEQSTTEPVDEGGLQTIMVTAQKRSENVQDVPISISTVTAASVQKAHTVNLEALTGAIPNVQIGHFSNNPQSAVFNIRG